MVRLIEYSENTGEYNMMYDKELLDEAVKGSQKEPVLRFYGWTPACVSLGRNQSIQSINTDYCNANNIDIVRRPTGGRGLFHNKEITYSFICSANILQNGESVINSYKEICSAIINGFKKLNINLTIGSDKQKKLSQSYCMLLSTGADLCFDNKKLIGSAQFRKQNYILQHGSILIDYNPLFIENIFHEKIYDEITYINKINPMLKRTDIINAITSSFISAFN